MMTIKEQIAILNSTFEKLHRDFESIDLDKANLNQKYLSLSINIKNQMQAKRESKENLKEEVLKYCRIAEDNSSKKFTTAGVSKMNPDLGKLNSLIERIDINKRDDNVAGQIIELSEHYVAFIDDEIRSIDELEKDQMTQLNNQKEHERLLLSEKKKQILLQCEKYLAGPDLKNLVDLFEMIHKSYEITNDYFTNWGNSVKKKRMMMIGYHQCKVDVPQMLCKTLKCCLNDHFDETTKNINSPFGYTTDSHEEIFVEYTDKNEDELNQGIQALILNYLRYFRPTDCRISIIDYIHYNADVLGPISVMGTVKNGIIDSIATDAKTLKQNITILTNYYRKVESKIGHESVFIYNQKQKPKDRIPLRILIINRKEEVFKNSEEPEMAYLVNNAEKFGITIIHMTKSSDGGSKGKRRERQYLTKAKDSIRIICNEQGKFFVENDIEWLEFKWLRAPSKLPEFFVDKVINAIKPIEIGTKYFKRFSMSIPERSKGKRKSIEIPFAIDEDDNVIKCSFENELFAAYMMGASRSGKSTLLHTIISGLLMNYHPDEVELWLLDFKMLEFKRYVDHRPPHIKYLLLEKSEDLVFDIIDQMTNELDNRQYIFSQNGWSKLTEVPPDIYMPVIFVIIDEFAQMSQILKETKGTGYGSDYTIKLENLLSKGAALGFKFIFASQTYTTGISGLTETACKQIQMRFALKNTPDEIKQTLTLSSDELNPTLSRDISSLPPYETLFKWRNENGEVKVGRFRNMYTESGEIDALILKINNEMQVGRAYKEKTPVLIDGSQPKTFSSQIPYYKKYEENVNKDDYDQDDVFIYSGVPCSFNVARPFVLCNGTAENIMIAGGNRERSISLILSILNSYGRHSKNVEIWAHDRDTIYKRYKDTVLGRIKKYAVLEDICNQVNNLKQSIQGRKSEEKLILCFGYEKICSDLEILGGDSTPRKKEYIEEQQNIEPQLDLSKVLELTQKVSSPEEKKKILDEYKMTLNEQNAKKVINKTESVEVYDARSDFEWVIKRASNYGIHFLLCFEQARDFINTRMDEKAFKHKIMFSMSKDESSTILGNRKANEIEEDTCVYTDGRESFTLRPHIYKGVPCNGWMIDENGKIIQRR